MKCCILCTLPPKSRRAPVHGLLLQLIHTTTLQSRLGCDRGTSFIKPLPITVGGTWYGTNTLWNWFLFRFISISGYTHWSTWNVHSSEGTVLRTKPPSTNTDGPGYFSKGSCQEEMRMTRNAGFLTSGNPSHISSRHTNHNGCFNKIFKLQFLRGIQSTHAYRARLNLTK